LDGKLVHDEIAVAPKRVFASAGYDEAASELVLKVINAGSEPCMTSLKLEGIENLSREGQITVLKAEKASDNNSLENPAKIVPITFKTAISGPNFTHEFPANSFSLIRVKTKFAKSASK